MNKKQIHFQSEKPEMKQEGKSSDHKNNPLESFYAFNQMVLHLVKFANENKIITILEENIKRTSNLDEYVPSEVEYKNNVLILKKVEEARKERMEGQVEIQKLMIELIKKLNLDKKYCE